MRNAIIALALLAMVPAGMLVNAHTGSHDKGLECGPAAQTHLGIDLMDVEIHSSEHAYMVMAGDEAFEMPIKHAECHIANGVHAGTKMDVYVSGKDIVAVRVVRADGAERAFLYRQIINKDDIIENAKLLENPIKDNALKITGLWLELLDEKKQVVAGRVFFCPKAGCKPAGDAHGHH